MNANDDGTGPKRFGMATVDGLFGPVLIAWCSCGARKRIRRLDRSAAAKWLDEHECKK